jgi:hypothetical protein
MKDWPKDNAPATFTDITAPVLRAVRYAYDLHRVNIDKDVPWEGLDIGERSKACSFSPPEALAAGYLAYSMEEQDRSALEVIIGVAVQLGIEQGRRMALEQQKVSLDLLKILTKSLRETIERL